MRQLDRWLLGAAIGWAGLLAINNSLPYLGLRDDSCQTMFCDMAWGRDWNTHYFIPQHAVSDVWASLEVTEVVIEPAPTSRRSRALARWLTAPDRGRNTEAVRVAIWQLCGEGYRISLEARRTDGEHAFVHHADACAIEALAAPHLWVPVRLYATDNPLPSEPE
jgi:hypothetical protein